MAATAALAAPGPKSREQIIEQAVSLKGTPYVWAGTTREGFDCSGFIYRMMLNGGYQVPRMADEQFYATQRVQRRDLRRGDLVFFTTYMPGPSHVGIFLGEGKFIHASSAGGGVIVSQMRDGYYSKAFIGGGRPEGYPAPDGGQAVAAAPKPRPAAAVAVATPGPVAAAKISAAAAAESAWHPPMALGPVTAAPSPLEPVASAPTPEEPVAAAPSPAEPVAAAVASASPGGPTLAVAASYAVELAPEVFAPAEPSLEGRATPSPGAPVVITDGGPPTMVASAPSPPPDQGVLPGDLSVPRGLQVNLAPLDQVWKYLSSWWATTERPGT